MGMDDIPDVSDPQSLASDRGAPARSKNRIAAVRRGLADRGKADAMLRESGERYRQLIDVAPDAIFVHSEERIVLVNPAMVQMFRAGSAEQLIGREVLDLIAPGSRELVRQRIRQLYETPQSVPLTEVEYVRLDGTQFAGEATAVSFSYAGRPAAQVVARDITSRKAAERALRESEQRFRALTELSSDWFWEQDTELRFVGTEGRTTLRAGISEADHIGKRRWELPGTEILGQNWDEHRAVLAARASFQDLVLKRTAADGSVHYVSVSGEPRCDATGAFAGYHGVAKDVTARYQAEAAVSEAQSRLRLTLDSAPAAIYFYDREERIVTANQGYADVMEKPPHEIVGHSIREAAGEAAYALAKPYIDRALAGETTVYERRRTRRDGRARDLRIQNVPYTNEAGRVTGACALIIDITDLKETQRALQASEARFRGLADLWADWYWEQDEQLRFTYLSPDFERIAGLSTVSPLGKTRWKVPSIGVTEEEWVRHRALVDARLPFNDFQMRRVNKHGELVWLSASGVPVYDDNGRFRGYHGIGRNITERKRAEAALRESEERFRSLTTLSSDLYWETDREHRFSVLEFGTKHRPLYPQQSLIGKTRWEIPWTAPDEDGWSRHRAVLDAHLPFRDFEFARARQDGVMFHYSVSGEPMFDSAGAFIGYRGVGREIGDRKRAEQALRQSSEEYEGLVSSIDGIVWEADPATFAFHFVSSQAERLLGYPSRQWLEEPDFWRNHTHPEDVAWAGEYCARATAEKRNHEFEYRMIAADGRTVWLRDLVAVVIEDGVVVKLRGIMVDVTDRRSAEQALRKSEERFRALTALSSDFYWETDREHRFVMMEYGKSFRGPMPSNEYAGKVRWEIPSVAPSEEGWRVHRETVDAHRSVRGFAFARRVPDGEIRHYEVDGDPLFDPGGAFMGYRGVGRDVTERLRAERALRDSERRVRALLRRLTATQEAERRRIAANLHDFVGQNLTALGIGLETLRGATAADAESRHASTFEELRNLLKDTMDTVRQTMADLRPPLLDDYGLLAALESHGRQFSLRTGLAVAVQGQRIGARPAPNVELALFRIAQEALANAVKHAGASRAAVALSCKGGFLRLSIEDDGSGFAQPSGARAALQGGWGLPMMRERAEEAGGTLRIEFPARGTRVVAEVPHVDSNHPG
jgi:PAS domain S-box-containing protein